MVQFFVKKTIKNAEIFLADWNNWVMVDVLQEVHIKFNSANGLLTTRLNGHWTIVPASFMELCILFVLQGLDPARVSVPVIGGHAGKTIIPLISQVHRLDKDKTIDDSTILRF